MSDEQQAQPLPPKHVSTGPNELTAELMEEISVLAAEVYRKALYSAEKMKLPFRYTHFVMVQALMMSVLKICEQCPDAMHPQIADEAALSLLQGLSINGVKPTDKISWRMQ